MDKHDTFWMPLDNAAKIFPAVRSREHTTAIRISVVLKDRVSITPLMKAITQAEKRFPYFKVSLHKGFFWYYLEQINEPLVAQVDDKLPCRALGYGRKNKLLLRVLVRKNRISVEISHILTDGYGALQFLNTLLLYYFREKGIISKEELAGVHELKMDEEEYEDAYNRYFREGIPPVVRQPKAFHLTFPLRRKPRFDLMLAILSISDLKKRSVEKGVSITDYLVAVYLLSLQSLIDDLKRRREYFNRRRLVRVQVPLNLRTRYPSKTMRNFSLFVLNEIDPRLGHYTFEELLKIVHHKMQLETDEKLINKIISRNVRSEKKLYIRGVPLYIKNLVLYFKFYTEGANQYSGVLTNLGKVGGLPPAVERNIEYYVLTPPPPNKKLKVNCGVIGFQDKLVLSFGNITESKELERRFLGFLAGQGVRVRLTKNR